MNAADAEALVSLMQAEWLAGEWLDDAGNLTTRGTMYALVLADAPPEDGAEAISRLRARIPYRQGPQTADLKAALAEVGRERTLDTPALPAPDGTAFREWYAAQPADMKARVRRVFPSLRLEEWSA